MFAIVVYGMVIFPEVLNHVEAAIMDLVEQVENQVNLVQAIVVETVTSRSGGWPRGNRHESLSEIDFPKHLLRTHKVYIRIKTHLKMDT